MIMSQEQLILKGQGQLEEMASFVRTAARDGRPIDEGSVDLIGTPGAYSGGLDK